jgi:hypothetical protein
LFFILICDQVYQEQVDEEQVFLPLVDDMGGEEVVEFLSSKGDVSIFYKDKHHPRRQHLYLAQFLQSVLKPL